MTSPMTEAKRKEIEERAAKAAPGPWKTYPNPMRNDGLFVAQDMPIEPYPNVHGVEGECLFPAVPHKAWGLNSQVEPDTARFIAHARTDVPALLTELRRLRKGLEEIANLSCDVSVHGEGAEYVMQRIAKELLNA